MLKENMYMKGYMEKKIGAEGELQAEDDVFLEFIV